MDQLSKYAPLIARIFIGLFFLLEGLGKLADVAGTAGYMEMVGLPGILVWPALLFEIALGLSILVGYKLRLAALYGPWLAGAIGHAIEQWNFAEALDLLDRAARNEGGSND